MNSRQDPKRFHRLVLVAGLLGWLGLGTDRAGAQYYGGLGPIQWPAVQFPLVQFPLVQFPAVSGFPGGYYGYGYINPYAYWDRWALADSYRMSKYALNSSRYNLATASMTTSAMANNLMAQGNYNELAWRRPPAPPESSGRYDVRGSLPGGAAGDPREEARSGLLAATTRSGDVVWPSFAPVKGDLFAKRQQANQAIKDVIGPNRSRGVAPVADVVHALSTLDAYAGPAVEQLRYDRPGDVSALLDFVNTLSQGLHALSSEPVSTNGEGFANDKPSTDTEAAKDAPKP